MKSKRTKSTIISIIMVGIILTGCSKNPLKDPNISEVDKARFLVGASEYAEKKLRLGREPSGNSYGKCMRAELSQKTCEKVYQYIVEYAKKDIDYKSLSLSDIKDRKVWHQLREYYGEESFKYVPGLWRRV